MPRQIEWSARAQKDFNDLDRVLSRRVQTAIERLAEGEGDVRRLTDVQPPLFRLRVGDWRVLFRYERETVVIMRILPRDKVYRS
jgi:mRNA-degrading endonuclease RelE of RelBE toxin-antitoxin system